MTDAEILAELGTDSLLNRVRRSVSGFVGKAEQSMQQRRAVPPIQLRRNEFEFAEKIIAMVREAAPPAGQEPAK